MTGPRVYYAMPKDGIFFPRFARLNKEKYTSASSIALQAAIANLMVVTSTFNALLLYIGFTLAMMRLRRLCPDEVPGYRTLGYPLTPRFFDADCGNLAFAVYFVCHKR